MLVFTGILIFFVIFDALKRKVMRKNIRVEIPRNPEKLIALVQQLLKQHEALDDYDPLKGLDFENQFFKLSTPNVVHDLSLWKKNKIVKSN
ncbi:MAG: hypothetical protein ACLGGV_01865 [Bacteroidia bacterium]